MEFSQEESGDLAITKFESMLKTNNVLFFDSEEFENIIHHYLNNGKVAIAKKAIKLGLEQHPTNTNLKLFKVEVCIFENNLKVAEKLLDELHIIEPTNEEIYIQKANLLSKADNHEKAILVLTKALELTQDKAELFSLIGMEYLFCDDFEKAKKAFMNSLALDPDDYTSLYNVIYCFEYLEETEGAITFLTEYLDSNPYCEVAWHQLGKQYTKIEDYQKAYNAYDFAIISDDRFVGAYIEKGKVLEKMNRYNDALENYAITLELEDPTSFALLRMAICHDKLGNDELAIKYYYKTVHEDPSLDKGWVAITRFYMKRRNYNKALHYINNAIEIDNNNVDYWMLYAKINHRLKHLEEAEIGYKRALELGDFEISTWLIRADLLTELGEDESATYNLLQASEFYPENAEIEFRLAGLYFNLHELEKAQYHLKNGLKFNPEFIMIIEELFPLVNESPLYQNTLKRLK